MSDDGYIAAARRALGERLAQCRSAAGLSQGQLASFVGYGRSTIATAETGRRTAALDFWQRCDDVLTTGGVLTRQYIGLRTVVEQQRRTLALTAQAERQARVLNGWRRAKETGAAAPTLDDELEPALAALGKPWKVGAPALDALASVLRGTRLLEDQTSSSAVLPTVRNLAAIADVYVGDARSAVRAQTLELASELHLYLGWLSFDAGCPPQQPGKAFDTAMSLAVEADNADHLAHAASFKGYVALKAERLDQAVTLSEVAQRDSRTLPALRAFDGYQAGWAHALAGQTRCAEHAMVTADQLLDNLPGDPLPDWGYWYHLPFLLTQRALVHEALGRPDRAIADLGAGLAEMPDEQRDADWARELEHRLGELRLRQ
ncbi:MAG TPA: helix-turn-helix transcriptional regulator [Pseudonocardiaceae bacterium]